jgi:hypothetical protein
MVNFAMERLFWRAFIAKASQRVQIWSDNATQVAPLVVFGDSAVEFQPVFIYYSIRNSYEAHGGVIPKETLPHSAFFLVGELDGCPG